MSEKNQNNLIIDNSQQVLDDLSISNDTQGSDSPSQSSGTFCVESKAMSNHIGWVKLHRQLVDNPISAKPTYLSLWVHLLMLANHEGGHRFIFNGEEKVLQVGQFLTGRKKLKELTGISETTIEDILKYFEKTRQIRQQKTTKNRIITILNWEKYQSSDNKPTTKRQQTDTFKNDKNVKNDKNINTMAVQSPAKVKQTFSQEGAEIIKAFETIDAKNKTYYANTTQRKACDFLLQEYGKDEVLKRIRALPVTNKTDYFPQITSPNDLKEKWEKLNAQVYKKLNNQNIIL
jgi:hypothetical protein